MLIALLLLLTINTIVGWLAGANLLIVPHYGISGSIQWGLYAGEFLFATLWLAFGPESILLRGAIVLNWGLILMYATWIGNFAAAGRHLFVYSHEIGQMTTTVPMAAISSASILFLIRAYGGYDFASRNNPFRFRLATLLTHVAIALCLMTGPAYLSGNNFKMFLDDLYWGIVVGGVMAVIATPIIPMTEIALLGEKFRPIFLILSFLTAWALGQLIALSFAIPGPGAAAVYANMEAGILSLIAVATLTLVTLCLNIGGYRFRILSMA